MGDDVQRSEGLRPPAKRILRGAARPVAGYFNRRFEDVHTHIDNPAGLQHLEAVMHGRFEHLLRELGDVRTEIAADADTVAELAFTLERFADLFTARMEEIAAQITAARSPARLEATAAHFPFAFAAASALEPGATVATVGDDGALSNGLTALGLQVTALEPAAAIPHADIGLVTGPLANWEGPREPLDAIFDLTGAIQAAPDTSPTRERLDLFRKWLDPSGLLVLGTRAVRGRSTATDDGTDLLSDWDIERRALLEQDAGGAWRHSDEISQDGIVLVRATPRA